MIRTNQKLMLSALALSMTLLASGCASNQDLYARYDAACDVKLEKNHEGQIIVKTLPAPPPKVITNTKVVEKIVEKVVTKEVPVHVQAKTEIWEPAVYFGFDEANLEAKELQRLDRDIAVMKNHPLVKVSVQAFTDVKGSNSYNVELANRRMYTVVDYLKAKGIAPQRIKAVPLGEELPILNRDTVEDRVINRRVELMLLDNNGRPLSIGIAADAGNKESFRAPGLVK